MSPSRHNAVVGVITASTIVLVLGVTQLTSMLVQRSAENDAAKNIATMKSEQAWLVGQGLALSRPIGVFNSSIFETNFRSEGVAGAHASAVHTIGLAESSLLVKMASRALGIGRVEQSISAGRDAAPSFGETAFGPEAAARLTYRHEEGHARMRDIPSPAASLPSLSPAASLIATTVVNAYFDASAEREPEGANWRASWMSSIRGEAYADAYSCLSIARASPAAMRDCAMSLHATRIFPTDGARDAAALSSIGDSHNVDMASFIVAQLDASAVAKLDGAGVGELSAKVADASLDWAIARQSSRMGFFSEDGEKWWMSEAKAAGVGASDARAAWVDFRGAAKSPKPSSVFGDISISAGGLDFKARGLSQVLGGYAWRFDGWGGLVPIEALSSRPAMQKALHAPNYDRIAASAFGAATATHWSLAQSVGADFSVEGARLSKVSSGKLANAPRFERFFESASLAQTRAISSNSDSALMSVSDKLRSRKASSPSPSRPDRAKLYGPKT